MKPKGTPKRWQSTCMNIAKYDHFFLFIYLFISYHISQLISTKTIFIYPSVIVQRNHQKYSRIYYQSSSKYRLTVLLIDLLCFSWTQTLRSLAKGKIRGLVTWISLTVPYLM